MILKARIYYTDFKNLHEYNYLLKSYQINRRSYHRNKSNNTLIMQEKWDSTQDRKITNTRVFNNSV